MSYEILSGLGDISLAALSPSGTQRASFPQSGVAYANTTIPQTATRQVTSVADAFAATQVAGRTFHNAAEYGHVARGGRGKQMAVGSRGKQRSGLFNFFRPATKAPCGPGMTLDFSGTKCVGATRCPPGQALNLSSAKCEVVPLPATSLVRTGPILNAQIQPAFVPAYPPAPATDLSLPGGIKIPADIPPIPPIPGTGDGDCQRGECSPQPPTPESPPDHTKLYVATAVALALVAGIAIVATRKKDQS